MYINYLRTELRIGATCKDSTMSSRWDLRMAYGCLYYRYYIPNGIKLKKLFAVLESL